MSFEVLNDERYIPIVVIGCTSSFLSMLGSGCVLFMSSREFKTFLMHRIMFALSLADFLSSTSSLLMPFSIPSTLGLAGAVGNHASCAASGFFLMTFILVGCVYNAGLSFYFYLVVCHGWKERDFKYRPEVLCHIFAFTVPLALNIFAVATQSINPSPLINNVCTYATYPWTCNENEDLDCTRSTETHTTTIVTLGGIVLFVFTIVGFVCTFLVWNNVRTTFARSSHYRFQADTAQSRTDQRILQVRTQAILYSLVYLNTFFWPFLATIFSNEHVHTTYEIQEIKLETGYYIFQILYWTFYPLQGALNFFVYTRLRFQRKRRENPELSHWAIYKQVILHSTSQTCSASRTSKNSQSKNKSGQQHRPNDPVNAQQAIQAQQQQQQQEQSPQQPTTETAEFHGESDGSNLDLCKNQSRFEN